MPVNTETSRGKEYLISYSFNRQDDASLILHRILAAQGESISIDDLYSDDGEIVSTTISVTEETNKHVYNLWNQLWNETRRGYAVWAAHVGAIYILHDEIFNEERNTSEDDGRFATSRVGLSALEECFVLGYERVNGYRRTNAMDPTGKGNPKLNEYYSSLKENGVQPIHPEAMGILLHQAIQELTPAT